ncbi:MAG: hypothetical protein AAFO75_13920, partial [Pseudomonadota bacterium]
MDCKEIRRLDERGRKISRIATELWPLLLMALVVTAAIAVVTSLGAGSSAPTVFLGFVVVVVASTQVIALLSKFGSISRACIEYTYYSLGIISVFLLFVQMDHPRDLIALQSASMDFAEAKNRFSFECRKEALAREPNNRAYAAYLKWDPISTGDTFREPMSEFDTYADILCLAAHAETGVG